VKTLIVGELNPYGSDPHFALYPLPAGAAGDRLCRILGLRRGDYLARFDRVNLCDGKWSASAARERAGEIMDSDHERVVLLGSKVAKAFGVPFRPFEFVPGCWQTLLVLPHPSGRCRIWNDHRSVTNAKLAVAELERRGGPA
jgi:hypothetical protein